MRKPAGTIDMTPTWEGVLPILMLGLERGSDKGRQAAREELQRMAQLADLYVASQKPELPASEPPKAVLAYSPGAPT